AAIWCRAGSASSSRACAESSRVIGFWYWSTCSYTVQGDQQALVIIGISCKVAGLVDRPPSACSSCRDQEPGASLMFFGICTMAEQSNPLLADLQARSLLSQASAQAELSEQLNLACRSIYCGFDP